MSLNNVRAEYHLDQGVGWLSQEDLEDGIRNFSPGLFNGSGSYN